jgi:transposase InsO family protein
MTQQPEQQPEDLAIWRFGVISPLLHRDPEGLPLFKAIENLTRTPFVLPSGSLKYFSGDTLRHWLYLFRQSGLKGLAGKVRCDKGRTSVPEALQEALTKGREEHPAWTVCRILDLLQREGQWNGRKPSRTSIYRFTSSRGLNRNPVKPIEPVSSFQFPHFGDLWSADFLHGPKVRVGRKEKKAYLHAILDDATRYIVAAEFHLAEDTRALISDLMLAVRRFGIPRRFYTDNGAAFRSRHLIRVAARLEITLHHTPAYKPQGRGKVERFFRHVRDGFLTGRPKTSLEALNRELNAWISLYHQRIHSALDMSPLDKRLQDKHALKTLDCITDIDALFRMEEYKTIYSDGCVRISGYTYDVPEALPGQKVKVSFLPWDLSVIYIGEDMKPARPLDKIKNAHRYPNPIQKRRNKP